MLYDAYEVQRSLLTSASKLAGLGAGWLNNPANPIAYSSMGPLVAASLDVFAHASAPRGKPEFGIIETRVGKKTVAVDEDIVLRKPFGQLKRFRKDGAEDQPPLLIVAPMSGHYATLASRHGRADAAQARRLHHRLARREAGAAVAKAASISTIISTISSNSLR